MKTVSTKEELKRAIENKQFPIKCVGEIGQQLIKRKKRSKAAKITGAALLVGGIAAIPFTGGASAAGAAAGASAMGLTIAGAGAGAIATISAAELAILLGGGIALVGILKGRKVRLKRDGSVEIY